MWFLAYDTLKNERLKTNFYNSTYNTSSLIKKMSLQQLSQTASTMYGSDFRIGRAIYSRGALMAIEMNEYLKKESGGKRSMKDVFRYYILVKKKTKGFYNGRISYCSTKHAILISLLFIKNATANCNFSNSIW
jgi:hypothetical protein